MGVTTREPTAKELAEALACKPVYKVVRKKDNGRLVSLWVKGTAKSPLISCNQYNEEFIGLTLNYRRGRVTSDGVYGIFCCKTMEAAKHQATGNGKHVLSLIFEAYPLGREIENTSSFGNIYGDVLYPAIILGSRILKRYDYR